jgi:hypothetical protein
MTLKEQVFSKIKKLGYEKRFFNYTVFSNYVLKVEAILGIDEKSDFYINNEIPIIILEIFIVQWGFFSEASFNMIQEQIDRTQLNGKISEEVYDFILIFSNYAVQISNGLLSIFSLISKGFNFQAGVLTRNLYEQVCMLLVMILDRQKASEYLATLFEDEKKVSEVWWKYFRMSEMRKVLDQEEKKLSDGNSLDFLIKWKEDQYNHYSEYTHASFRSISSNSSTLFSMDSESQIESNLWGNHVYKVDGTIDSLLEVAMYLDMRFLRLINDGVIDESQLRTQSFENIWDYAKWLTDIAGDLFYSYLRLKENDQLNSKVKTGLS